MPISRSIQALCFFFCGAAVSLAQVTSGPQPQGTLITKNADVINVGNNNILLAIPVISKQGRGTPFSYSLTLNSSIWYPVHSGSATTWQPASFDGSALGWQGLNPAASTGASYTETIQTLTCYNSNPAVSFQQDIFMPAGYLANSGVFYPLNQSSTPLIWFNVRPGSGSSCPPNGPVNSSLNVSNGGYSGTMSFASTTASSPSIAFQLKDSQGNSLNPAVNASSGPYVGPQTTTDANGNQVAGNSGQYTDTTGSTVLSVIYSPASGSQPAGTFLKYNLPGGTTNADRVYYQTATVATNFGCRSIGEYGPVSTSLVSSVQTPSGTYSFTYEATPNQPGYTTGRVASITVPSGGKISYTYSGGNNGVDCGDGSTPSLTRTTTDGSSSYVRAGIGYSGSTTTVTDEKSNQSVFTFSQAVLSQTAPVQVVAPYETHRKIYQGSATGTPLEEVVTCYNGQSGNCDGQNIQAPATEIDVTTSYNGGSVSTVKNTYDSTGVVVTGAAQYGGNTLLASTTNAYSISPPLYELTSTKVTDGSGNTVAYSSFGYDESAPVATSGIAQHWGAPRSARGNRTSSHVSIDGSTTNTLDTTTIYYDTGQPVSTTTPNGTTGYTYDSTQTFVQGTTLPTPSSNVALATTATYDPVSGVMTSATGMNAGQTLNVTQFDAALHPTTVTTPEGGQSTAAYGSNGTSMQTLMSNSGGVQQSSNQETLFDPYGRTSRVAVAVGGSAWYVTDFCYDATGLLHSQSVAYSSSALNPYGQHCSSSTATQYTYDALGRVILTTTPDGNTVTTTYNSHAVEVADANGTTRIVQYDLLGRQSGVCEVVPAGSTFIGDSASACSLPGGSFDIAGTGFSTSYAYNLAGHSTTITQGVQTRIFQTDAAGRTLSITEPEAGTTTYSYSYNGTGQKMVRTRPMANQTSPSSLTATTTQYDKLGRIVSVTYSDGTPTRTFAYDQPPSSGTNYNKGQLTSMSNSAHSRTYTSDVMGRVSQTSECLPGYGCVAANTVVRSYGYDLASNLINETYGSQLNNGSPVSVGYRYNPAGQLTAVTGGQNNGFSGASLYTVAMQTPGGPGTVNYGNGLSLSLGYDAMNRSSTRSLGNGSTSYFANSTQQVGGRIQTVSDSVLNRTTNYSYDALGNLSGSSGSNGLGFAATYDRYGNRWSESFSNPPSGMSGNPSVMYNQANNQLQGFGYDAAGNQTSDGVHSYTYDGENNLIAIDGGSTARYVFDAANERVQVASAGTVTAYGFDLAGRRATAWTNGAGSVSQVQYYAGGQAVAYWSGVDASLHLEHQDYLGTERLRSNAQGVIESTYASLPYGEMNQTTGTDTVAGHFATLDQDGASGLGLSHAFNREYSSNQGRWMSPDAYGGSYDQTAPQSYNRYEYVMNNPLALTDRSGQDWGNPNCVNPATPGAGAQTGPQQAICTPVWDESITVYANSTPCYQDASCAQTQPSSPAQQQSNGYGMGSGGNTTSAQNAPNKPAPTPAPPKGNSWSHPLTPPTCQQWKNWGKADAYFAGGGALVAKTFPITAPVTVPFATLLGFSALIENGVAWAQGCYF